MKVGRFDNWFWYMADEEPEFDESKCGKWMFFFADQEFAQRMCMRAIEQEACQECKCTDMESSGEPRGVTCFYIEGDDLEAHKSVLSFMLENNLIRRTKTGRLFNISFKFDDQTRAGEYGADFEGKLKLDQFVDLQTGEWL